MLSETEGTLSMSSLIPLSVPAIRGNEWKYIKECLDTGWVSSVGPFVTRFENEIAAYVGASHAVATASGTAALHLALLAIGLQPEDEVLVSDLTFIAPVNAIRYCHAHPVFMDVHPETWMMDPRKVSQFLEEECVERNGECYNRRTGRRVRAMLPVHILGLSCDMQQLVELASRHGLQVVEDAAEGMGVFYRGRHVGTFGDVGIFSFNGNKVMTTGGGGMLVTNDPRIAERARYLSTQAKDDPIESVHREIGFNYRLTNIQAAMGLAQLEQLEGFVVRKRQIAETYRRALEPIDGLAVMPTPPNCTPTYWLYTVLLQESMQAEDRKHFIGQLCRAGIEARSFWHPIHGLPPYSHCQAFRIQYATSLFRRGVSLPSSVGLSDSDQARCIEAVKRTLLL